MVNYTGSCGDLCINLYWTMLTYFRFLLLFVSFYGFYLDFILCQHLFGDLVQQLKDMFCKGCAEVVVLTLGR